MGECGVEHRKHARAPHQHVDAGAERGEDARELHRDEPAAYDYERPGRGGVAQRIIGCVGEGRTGNGRDYRRRPRSDDDAIRVEHLVAHCNRARRDEPRFPVDYPDASLGEERGLVARERLLNVPLPRQYFGPVHPDVAARDSELVCSAGITHGARGHVERLLGYASAPKAGAANAV